MKLSQYIVFFYLILYPQQVILDIREKNESVTADTQKIFQQNKQIYSVEFGIVRG